MSNHAFFRTRMLPADTTSADVVSGDRSELSIHVVDSDHDIISARSSGSGISSDERFKSLDVAGGAAVLLILWFLLG